MKNVNVHNAQGCACMELVPGNKKKAECLNRREQRLLASAVVFLTMAALCMILTPAFASGYVGTIQGIMDKMVDIVGTIFQAVGVILSIYAVGQLILAFKNEDANAKSQASTLLVVGIVLIALPGIVDTLGLVDMIGG